MERKNLVKTILFSLIGFLCLLFVVSEIFWTDFTQTIGNTLVKASTQQPETFTELYFEKHTTELPKLLAYQDQFEWYDNPTSNLYTFSFTITNREQKDMTYRYEVYSVSGNDDKKIIDRNEIAIPSNEARTTVENFSLPSNYTRTKVTVNLIDKKQDISFWVEVIK